MSVWYWILGVIGLVAGGVLASRRGVEPRLRLAAGVLALAALFVILYAWLWSPSGENRQVQAANRRQAYTLGFGLGQFLKQTQPGRPLAILWASPKSGRDKETFDGFKDGLAGQLQIVAERAVDLSRATNYWAASVLLTPELLADLKGGGADIVVSFAGLPMKIDEYTDLLDPKGTLALWRSPEYHALQWVLPYPPEPWPPGCFREGRVLAVVREKPITYRSGEIPASLEIEGSPAELFDAWFELVTTDDGG